MGHRSGLFREIVVSESKRLSRFQLAGFSASPMLRKGLSHCRAGSSFALGAAVVICATSIVPVRAENSRQTITWQTYDDKDPLTDKVIPQVAGQVKFSDGNMVQVYAKCGELAAGGKYPGMSLVVGTFDATTSAPKAYAWEKGTIALPIVLNDRQRPAVRASTDNPRANLIAIGFYDPAAAKRLTHVEVSPFMQQIDAFRSVVAMKQQVAWDNFVANAGGTLAELLQATSIRVQLPLIDASADVIEINPQDATLRAYAEACNARFQTRPR